MKAIKIAKHIMTAGDFYSAIPRYFSLPVILFTSLLLVTSSFASAHFQINLNVRIMHFEHTSSGANLYMRLPLPYLLADKLGLPAAEGQLPEPAPFTHNAMENGKLVHFIDYQQVRANPLGLGDIVALATRVDSGSVSFPGQVTAVRLHSLGREPNFATLIEAEAAFAKDSRFPANSDIYVGDAVIDIRLHYPDATGLQRYRISSSLNPGLPDQDKTANLVLDHRAGKTQVFRTSGLLSEPIEISHSTAAAMSTFVREGIVHILEGWDHLLFVLCLTLGASTITALLWRATGFTLGHSITLCTGFFGLVPSGVWFVPLVETGIALSIIYVAWKALRRGVDSSHGELWICAGTAALGMLHGLGFSFVLHKILQVDAPNIWQSLLAFNLGVEIGQALIILAIWPLLMLVRHWRQTWEPRVRLAVALPCCAIALVWTFDRSVQFINALMT